MLALCHRHNTYSYYAQNYAGIIRMSLNLSIIIYRVPKVALTASALNQIVRETKAFT